MESMKRTATCGELDASGIGRQVTLNGWVHRVRDHGGIKFIDLRDRYGLTQVVVDADASAELKEAAAELKHEYTVAVEGTVRPRPANMVNPQHAHRPDRGPGPAPGRAGPLRDPALPDRRAHGRPRGTALQVPLPGPALLRHAAPHPPAPRRDLRRARVPGRPRLLRDRDPDPDPLHPGRGARLPGALAPARRQVLRAAPVAAALQAAADGVRLRQVLPDRPLLPRRGRPRRPAAGVHPDRPGDELRVQGRRVRGDRGPAGPRVPQGHGPGAAHPLPAPDLRRRHEPLRLGQARLALRPGAEGLRCPGSKRGVRGVPQARRRGRDGEGPGGPRLRRLLAQGDRGAGGSRQGVRRQRPGLDEGHRSGAGGRHRQVLRRAGRRAGPGARGAARGT